MLVRNSLRSHLLKSATRLSLIPVQSWKSQTSTYATTAAESFNTTESAGRQTVKPLNSRKTYLVDVYSQLLKKSPVVLVVHHNNLLKDDDRALRAQIKTAGGELIITRANLFKVALRGMEHDDPASKEAQKQFKKSQHPIFPLLSGPTGIIAFPELDPKAVDNVVKALDKSKGNLVLLGAYVDKKVLSVEDVNVFKALPNLAEVRSQLVGVLSILGGAGLVQTLEASSKVLYLTMDERRKQLEPSTETSESTESSESPEK